MTDKDMNNPLYVRKWGDQKDKNMNFAEYYHPK